jgi:hypothetical protein
MLALPYPLDQLSCWLRVKSTTQNLVSSRGIASAIIVATSQLTRHLVTAFHWGIEVTEEGFLTKGRWFTA